MREVTFIYRRNKEEYATCCSFATPTPTYPTSVHPCVSYIGTTTIGILGRRVTACSGTAVLVSLLGQVGGKTGKASKDNSWTIIGRKTNPIKTKLFVCPGVSCTSSDMCSSCSTRVIRLSVSYEPTDHLLSTLQQCNVQQYCCCRTSADIPGSIINNTLFSYIYIDTSV